MDNAKIFPHTYLGDHCRKYVPKVGLKSFLEEMLYTENELINYFPPRIRQKNKVFKTLKTTFSVLFLTTGLLFMTFCDRIRFIRNTFTNKWALFGFKGAILAFCFWTIFNYEENACKENLSDIYRLVADDYKNYKQSGNFLSLNPSIILVEDQIAPKISLSIIN